MTTGTLADRLAEEVRALMGRRRIRQSQLSRLLGVNEVWVSRRLGGQIAISLADLERIADALEVDPIDLLSAARGGTTLRQVGGAVRPVERRPPGHPVGPGGPARTARTRPRSAA